MGGIGLTEPGNDVLPCGFIRLQFIDRRGTDGGLRISRAEAGKSGHHNGHHQTQGK